MKAKYFDLNLRNLRRYAAMMAAITFFIFTILLSIPITANAAVYSMEHSGR